MDASDSNTDRQVANRRLQSGMTAVKGCMTMHCLPGSKRLRKRRPDVCGQEESGLNEGSTASHSPSSEFRTAEINSKVGDVA